jgi:hypothetical protein
MDDLQSLLIEFLDGEDSHQWIIDPAVYFDGNWEEFLLVFDACTADLLATVVRTHADDPGWNWWASLEDHHGSAAYENGVAALLPLIRVSRAAARAILDGLSAGWSGHPEVLIPTLVHQASLVIEDFGNDGSFTPPERKGLWYHPRSWQWRGPVEYIPGRLHFPVPLQDRSLAPSRIEAHDDGCDPRCLYVSPVGGGARDLLPGMLERFRDAGADCLLLQYDEADLPIPPGVRVIRDRGYKWQLALRHLDPDEISAYDYIFFWDDDIGVADFDPLRFIQIMRANRLDMAQPAIQSPHGLSHSITGHRSCPMPRREPDGESVHLVVGRLTNFVEIMVPVFTREAWREFHRYLDAENRSGWGYDYIPLGRKGVIDALPVIHTRAVQSMNGESENDIRRFLDHHGLFRHAAVDQGWLLESRKFTRRDSYESATRTGIEHRDPAGPH